jgi:hypothetical protein
MTSTPRHRHGDPPSLSRTGAGILAASIAAAAIVGMLTFVQSAPLGVQTGTVPASVDKVRQRSTVEPPDAGVDRHRAVHAPEPDGASAAADQR